MGTSHNEAPTYLSNFIYCHAPKYIQPFNTISLLYFGFRTYPTSHFAFVHAAPSAYCSILLPLQEIKPYLCFKVHLKKSTIFMKYFLFTHSIFPSLLYFHITVNVSSAKICTHISFNPQNYFLGSVLCPIFR